MTVKELYEWAEANNVLDFDIETQHEDEDGWCYDWNKYEPRIKRRTQPRHTEFVIVL